MVQSVQDRGHLRIFAIKVGSKLTEQEWDIILSQLPSGDQIRIMKFKEWKDRQRALLGAALIRWCIRNYVTRNADVHVIRDKNNRPYLVEGMWKGDFNLSHSGEWITLALVDKGKVGIDVEMITYLDEETIEFALTETELKRLHKELPNRSISLFFEMWTMKEAIYKTGLFPHITSHLIDIYNIQANDKDIHTKLFYLDSNHPVSVCWNQSISFNGIVILDRQELLKKLVTVKLFPI